jgi:dihydroorotase
VLSYHSLNHGKNVLVDGSLRNAHWYLEYFKNLRARFPTIKIAILHVTAKPESVLQRARNRAKVTGRHVPEETILESMRTIPVSHRPVLLCCIALK